MSRETKIAFAMVLVLGCVSGYVFYRKLDQQKEMLAKVQAEKDAEENGGVKPATRRARSTAK